MIERHTIAIYNDEDADADLLPIIDALRSFGKSRATKLLIRRGVENNIHCKLRIPLLRQGSVRPVELGRVVRKVWRAAIVTADPGDQFVIKLYVGHDSRLVVQAESSA